MKAHSSVAWLCVAGSVNGLAPGVAAFSWCSHKHLEEQSLLAVLCQQQERNFIIKASQHPLVPLRFLTCRYQQGRCDS